MSSARAMLGRMRGFAPRPVPWRSGGQLLRESAAILAAAPGRLVGMYLLVYLPVQLLSGTAYLAMPLRGILASVAFAGYFCALETARRGNVPGLLDMARPWRLPPDKLILLGLAGLVPVLLVWLAWWIDLGGPALDKLLTAPLAEAATDRAAQVAGEPLTAFLSVSNPALAQRIEAVTIENILDIPLLLLQPLCVLHTWSATRTLSANLLASLANWRWGLCLAVVLAPIGLALYSFHPDSLAGNLLLLVTDVGLGIYLSAFTLVLMHHSLD
jgi:hypothetical protein